MYATAWRLPKIPFNAMEVLTFLHVWLAFLLAHMWLRGKTGGLASAFGAAVFAYTGYISGKSPPLPPCPPRPAIRITGGSFRLLNPLLTQIERILEINALQQVTKALVEAARESLVIGQA
jgi:hypothetical protein